eukprot:6183553-Pleurochrysis_carterae.AAC.1
MRVSGAPRPVDPEDERLPEAGADLRDAMREPLCGEGDGVARAETDARRCRSATETHLHGRRRTVRGRTARRRSAGAGARVQRRACLCAHARRKSADVCVRVRACACVCAGVRASAQQFARMCKRARARICPFARERLWMYVGIMVVERAGACGSIWHLRVGMRCSPCMP